MQTKPARTEPIPPDATLHEELSAVADEDIVEMANLFPDDTGVDGVIFISTSMASHGPRVKCSQKAGRHQPSFSVSIGDQPRILANSLPERVVNRLAPNVLEWVRLNKEALLQFWNEGDTWPVDELLGFTKRLKKLTHD